MDHFKLVSEYAPAGDQPAAIEALVEGLKRGNQFQTFLGVIGSGKTFTMANIIQALNKPALVIAHNKTLAGQLYGEFKEFFPENAVEYSVFWHVYVLIILNIELRCIAKYNIWYADRLLILKWTVWNRHNGEQNSWREEIEKKFWGIYNNIKGYVKWTLIMGGS